MWTTLTRADRASGGLRPLWLDGGLYLGSAIFAAATGAWSTLAPHRVWGQLAAIGYAVAVVVVAAQLILGRRTGRLALVIVVWVMTAVVPLVVEAVQRASGTAGRAQEEVVVIEGAGTRLIDLGTPYLDRTGIAALPDPLLGYVPYQPGMSVFGLPRAVDSAGGWWSDARVWFAVVTGAVIAWALVVLRRAEQATVVRALQGVTVFPVAALTLATGGDDLPVLAFCLLGLSFAAVHRFGAAGLAIGAAAAMKLFAWPVALIVGVYAASRGAGWRYAAAALVLPVLTLAPTLLRPAGLVENVIVFPFGHGLVASPATSPLPGHLIATYLPGGALIARIILGLAVIAFLVILVRRPPRTAVDSARLSAYALAAATLLLPATRFGYVLYPVALLMWAPALRLPATDAR